MCDAGVTLYCLPAGALLSPEVCVQLSSSNFIDFLRRFTKAKFCTYIGRDQELQHVQIYVLEFIL